MANNPFYSKFTEKRTPKKSKQENTKDSKSLAKKNNPKSDKPIKEYKTSKPADFKKNKFSQKKEAESENSWKLLSSAFTNTLSKESVDVLENFDDIIQGIRPLNSKQLQQLPENIKALSHQLTDERSTRRLGYMNESVQLSSYIRYYTWWNLVRLTRLFANLPAEAFPSADEDSKQKVALDLGSGPLTVLIALWLARPELRNIPLTWYCLDVSANSMALGEDVFLSVAARTGFGSQGPWKIIRVKGPFGTSIKQKADFITCANMFNELDQASDMPPEFQTKKYYEQLKNYGNEDCRFLLIEPGVPKSARTISLLRERFISAGLNIVSPCTHCVECPMNGFKAYTGSQNKWCNFSFNTEDAPKKLQKLSEHAKLPKERATLCFVSASKAPAELKDGKITLCRVVSDPFQLPKHRTGFYACSELGLTLITISSSKSKISRAEETNKLIIEGPFHSGDLLSVKIKTPDSLPVDEKSGAVVISL